MIYKGSVMKKNFLLCYLIFTVTVVFAFTPHINKGKITELTLGQAEKELNLSEIEIKELNKEYFGFLETFTNFPPMEEVIPDGLFLIYKQTFDETNETLYRVFIETSNVFESKDDKNIFQKIYYSNGKAKVNLLFADYYNGLVDYRASSFSLVQLNTNIMPIIKNSRIAGIMIYGIESYTSYGHTDEYSSLSEITSKNLTHAARVFWREDFSTADLKHTSRNKPDIYIECSKPLIDEKDTFKYTIQNAFDGDPATSYVENTEDDLIEINISAGVKIQKAMIINGYAKNRELYNANNRCKVISPVKWDKNKGSWYSSPDISNSFQLSDNTFTEQMINLSTSYFYVTDIYQGSKFNDTCIAELNFKHSNGWLFGDIDEQ